MCTRENYNDLHNFLLVVQEKIFSCATRKLGVLSALRAKLFDDWASNSD